MHTKIMEGLVGANTNMDLLNTPMQIFKEASRRDDLATMERAGKYAGEFAGRVADYKTEADDGLEEDAKEAREKAESEREKAIQKRKEEREEFEQRITDIGGTEKNVGNFRQSLGKPVGGEKGVQRTGEERSGVVNKAPAIYTRDGRVNQTGVNMTISV